MMEFVTLTGKEFDTLMLLANKDCIKPIPKEQVRITQDYNKDGETVYGLLFALTGFVYIETSVFLESVASFVNKINLGTKYTWNRDTFQFNFDGDNHVVSTIENVLKTVCKYADEFLSSTKDVSYVKNKIDDTIQLDTVYRVYTNNKKDPELFTHLIIHRFPACGDKEFYNLSLYNQNAEDITNFQVYSETFNSMDDLLNTLNYRLSITNIMKDQFFEFLFHVIFTHKCNTQVELSQKVLHSYENRNFQFGFDGFEKPEKRSNPTCNITVTDPSK